MNKWSFPKNTTSLEKLYILTKAVADGSITDKNHSTELMQALNEGGAKRTEANHHPLNYVCFYKMVEKRNDHYEVTEYGKELLNRYEALQDEEKCAKFFFKVLLDIQYPNDYVGTDTTYQIYPFRILFQALLDERLHQRITKEEFKNYFSVVKNEEDYEKLVKIILNSRNHIEPAEEILPIPQETTILSGWINQFHVIDSKGPYLVFKESLKYDLYPLTMIKSEPITKLEQSFRTTTLKKYLFENLSMMKIEDEAYQTVGRKGLLVKEILDYYQVHKDANGFYQNQNINEVARFLLVQPDKRYRKVAQVLLENKETEINIQLEDFRRYYQKNRKDIYELEHIKNFEQTRQEFLTEFPLERLKSLTLEEFIVGQGSKQSLAYQLEFGKYKDVGPSVKGKNSGKFGIYRTKDGDYCGFNNQIIENPEVYFERLKDQLYQFLKNGITDLLNYDMTEQYPELKGTSMFLIKLAYLYHPESFIGICSNSKLRLLCNHFYPANNTTWSSEQMSYFLNQRLKEDLPFLKEESSEVLCYALYHFIDDVILAEPEEEIVEYTIKTGADSILYYGVPGCGKSHIVNELYCQTKNHIRVTFHPEYTNGEFVGQIFPTLKTIFKEDGTEEKIVEYSFKQGPMIRILKQALENREEPYYLIIEELNRGNAEAIFGEIFELLDRDEQGNSKYSIYHEDISREIYGNSTTPIKLPSNLYIIATMNSCDQNVFTLDTAFKRRWTMEKISNLFDMTNPGIEAIAKLRVPNTPITWKTFVETINQEIMDEKYGIDGEDKQLGIFFVKKDCLRSDDTENSTTTKKFAHKVLMYLWEDVVKYGREYMFKDCKTLDELIEKFNQIGLDVFDPSITFKEQQDA